MLSLLFLAHKPEISLFLSLYRCCSRDESPLDKNLRCASRFASPRISSEVLDPNSFYYADSEKIFQDSIVADESLKILVVALKMLKGSYG